MFCDSGGPWKCKTPLSLKATPFQLVPEESFVCNSGENPITCPYQFDVKSGRITRGHLDRQPQYDLDVSVNSDGKILHVEWNKNTLLVADNKIRKFQVLLYSDVQYMAITFPVPKDQHSLVLTDVLPSDVSKFNVCVEVIGIYNDVIKFSCVLLFISQDERSDGSSHAKLAIFVGVPVALIIIALMAFLVCTTFRKPVSSKRAEGIRNVMYDHYMENELTSETQNTSQITISGLPSGNGTQETIA